MAHSVELRTPFVDWVFFNKIIPLLKADKNINKISTLNCVKKRIPSEIFNRKKTGFAIPHDKYLKHFSVTKKFNNSFRDWSLLSYKKYFENNKLN